MKEYQEACIALNAEFLKGHPLHDDAMNVYLEVKNLVRKRKLPLNKVTAMIKTITNVLKGPSGEDKTKEIYRQEVVKLQRQSNELRTFPLAKILISAALCLLGVAIIVASGILAAVSFGLAVPITILGILFGFSKIMSIVAISSGIIGASCLLFPAPIMASAWRDQPIRDEIKELRSNAKRTYGI